MMISSVILLAHTSREKKKCFLSWFGFMTHSSRAWCTQLWHILIFPILKGVATFAAEYMVI